MSAINNFLRTHFLPSRFGKLEKKQKWKLITSSIALGILLPPIGLITIPFVWKNMVNRFTKINAKQPGNAGASADATLRAAKQSGVLNKESPSRPLNNHNGPRKTKDDSQSDNPTDIDDSESSDSSPSSSSDSDRSSSSSSDSENDSFDPKRRPSLEKSAEKRTPATQGVTRTLEDQQRELEALGILFYGPKDDCELRRNGDFAFVRFVNDSLWLFYKENSDMKFLLCEQNVNLLGILNSLKLYPRRESPQAPMTTTVSMNSIERHLINRIVNAIVTAYDTHQEASSNREDDPALPTDVSASKSPLDHINTSQVVLVSDQPPVGKVSEELEVGPDLENQHPDMNAAQLIDLTDLPSVEEMLDELVVRPNMNAAQVIDSTDLPSAEEMSDAEGQSLGMNDAQIINPEHLPSLDELIDVPNAEHKKSNTELSGNLGESQMIDSSVLPSEAEVDQFQNDMKASRKSRKHIKKASSKEAPESEKSNKGRRHRKALERKKVSSRQASEMNTVKFQNFREKLEKLKREKYERDVAEIKARDQLFKEGEALPALQHPGDWVLEESDEVLKLHYIKKSTKKLTPKISTKEINKFKSDLLATINFYIDKRKAQQKIKGRKKRDISKDTKNILKEAERLYN